MINMFKTAVYVHIPFCLSKCYYCDFVSFKNINESLIIAYHNSLINEINACKKLKMSEIISIFIGGGTQTIMESELLEGILVAILDNALAVSADIEVTIEANPGTLNENMLMYIADGSFNRLSIGLQAAQTHILQGLGRTHSFDDFLYNYNDAVAKGIKNINIDLMFAVPNQSIKDWKNSLKKTLKLHPTHVSIYSLVLEEGTKLYKLYIEGKITMPTDEQDRDMYRVAVQTLKDEGYVHYEISNFSQPGYESRHNMTYWNMGYYLGYGLAAHSFFMDTRFNNTSNLQRYIKSITNSLSSIERVIAVSKRDKMAEFMFLGLRLIKGISITRFRDLFNEDIFDVYGSSIDTCIDKGLLNLRGDYLSLTTKWLDIASIVFIEFI